MASIAAAEIIGGDLAVEILQHLPAKSLFRFKSVSKAWLSLISTPRFSFLFWQSLHHPKVSGLFFDPRSQTVTIKYIPLTHSDDLRIQCDIATVINGGEENNPPFPPDMYARIIDSRNGFLLVYFNKMQRCSSSWRRSYHVYNPTTKQFSTLPWPFPFTFTSSIGDNLYLIFDPLKSLHYKVVLVKASGHGNAYLIQIHIYSSKTNDWRRSPLDDDIGDFRSVDLSEGVYCNGSIHWLSYHEEKTSLYLDVDQERFCPMPSPPYNSDAGFKCRHFGESGGHLHYIRYYDNMGFNVNVLEMESDYSKWTNKYRVCLDTIVVDLALEVVPENTKLSLIHGEDEGDVFLVLVVGTEMNYMIISYNIKENTFKKRVEPRRPWYDSGVLWRRHSCIYRCIETLFPV